MQKKEEKPKKAPIYRLSYDKNERLWKITKDGAKRTIDSYFVKEDAMKRIKELSDAHDIGFVVKKKDGKFQKKN